MEIYLLFLSIGLIAVLGDFIVPYILGKKYLNYSNTKDAISELGTNKSPVKRQFSCWLITLGILLIIFSIGHTFIFSVYSWKHILYISGIIIFGVGCIISGIFAEDSKGSKETKSGKIHGISSGLGFIFLIFNPLWMSGIAEINSLKIFNLIFFILGLLSFVIFIISNYKKGAVISLTGLWQRINLVTLYIPMIVNYLILAA